MEKKRMLFFASQGLKPQELEVAPEVQTEVESKRAPLIKEEDRDLDSNITDLDVGTRRRNRAFQERLDDIWSDTRKWESHLKTEAKEAVETILDMRDEYQRHLNDFSQSLRDEVNAIYDKRDNVTLVEETTRIDVIEKDLAVFVKDTVPANIERNSGEISRNLRRAYETFDIEKTKERKRETKLVAKANKHIKNCAQRVEDEAALMSSVFFNVEDDVVEHEARSARMHQLRNSAAQQQVRTLNAVSEAECTTRTAEDVEVLDTVIETQRLLQKTVLQHFGTSTGEEEEDEDAPIEMTKLKGRMAKIGARKAGDGGEQGEGEGEGKGEGEGERGD